MVHNTATFHSLFQFLATPPVITHGQAFQDLRKHCRERYVVSLRLSLYFFFSVDSPVVLVLLGLCEQYFVKTNTISPEELFIVAHTYTITTREKRKSIWGMLMLPCALVSLTYL